MGYLSALQWRKNAHKVKGSSTGAMLFPRKTKTPRLRID
jgi:hypothetical protein